MTTTVRYTVDHAVELSKYKPRRLLVRDHTSFDGYRVTIQAAERIADQLRSVATGLVRVAERQVDERQSRYDAYLRTYGALLADEAGRCRAALHELASHAQGHRLDEWIQPVVATPCRDREFS